MGVVVNPTRISNLAEFGTPQFVADKLIQAERRKVRPVSLFLSIVVDCWCTLMCNLRTNSAESCGATKEK